MRRGWGLRRRFHKVAAALVVLALLPVAILVAAHASAAQASTALTRSQFSAEDVDLPAVDALQRSQASNLFAPFAWDGWTVSGPFVTFDFSESSGSLVGLMALNGSQTDLLVDTIRILGFDGVTPPQASGSTFTANGNGVSFIAHDEPTALFEVVTTNVPRTVEITFPNATSDLEVSRATGWPEASLSFTKGETTGRMIVGAGTMTVNGTRVTAQLGAYDTLAFRAVPSFLGHRAERTAILDAFASGRLAAEYEMVAMTNGGWLESGTEYNPALSMTSHGVRFEAATLALTSAPGQEGLILVAFDPQTMPSDAAHQIVVTDEGMPVPQTENPLMTLYAAPGTAPRASFSLFSMNATVLAIYLPSLSSSSLQIQSLPASPAGPDLPTEFAMVAALFVVSMAAATMFRTRRD